MTTTTPTDPAVSPDTVIAFRIHPGTLLDLLHARSNTGPRLICLAGSVTLVSPGRSHESMGRRLDFLILAVSLELRIKLDGLESITRKLPFGAGETAYEADRA